MSQPTIDRRARAGAAMRHERVRLAAARRSNAIDIDVDALDRRSAWPLHRIRWFLLSQCGQGPQLPDSAPA